MTKKIGIVGSMINTSDYLLFKDLGERYILKRYDSIEQANNDDCYCIIVTDGDKDCRDNGACVLTYHDNPISNEYIYSPNQPKTKCRAKDERCTSKQISKRRKKNKNKKTHRRK